jgi:hypothetical protein
MELSLARIVCIHRFARRDARVGNASALQERVALGICHRSLIALALLTLFPAFLAAELAPTATRVDVCGPIAADTTWTPANLYVITCEVTVAKGVTLTVLPGTIVKANPGGYTPSAITVFGRLVAEGTPDAPIVFTSIKDDEHGGDTENDGPWAVPGPGNWQSINFEAGSSGSISNALIAYGGWWYFYDNEGLVRCNDADIKLDRVTLRVGSVAGLSAIRCGVEFTNSTMADNGSGLQVFGLAADAPFTLTNNVFGPRAAGTVHFDGNPHGPVSIHDNVAVDGKTGLILRGTLKADLDWENDELVLLLVTGLTVAPEATLLLAPGSVVKSDLFSGSAIEVNGTLLAEGTPAAPIVFTSIRDDEHGGDTNADGSNTTTGPGQWSGVTVNAGGGARIAHAEMLYGGNYYYFSYSNALVRAVGGEVSLDDVTLRASNWNAIYSENGSVLVRGSRMEDNWWNVRNDTPKVVVDARYNWWGDPSGPHHGTKNPDGQGKDVTDGVLFFPWAVDVDGTVPVQVLLEGPARVSPGQSAEYAITYYASQPIHDAVMVFALPAGAEYVDGSAGAILWWDRGEVFWRLGDLAAGDAGDLALRVRFAWGLPTRTVGSASAILAGSDFGQEYREVEPYLSFTAPEVDVTARLTPEQLDAERQQYADFDDLCRRALTAGFGYVGAVQIESSGRGPATVAVFTRLDRSYALVSRHQGAASLFTEGPTGRAIEDTGGGVRFDRQTFQTAFWGTWSADAEASAAGGAFGRQAFQCTEKICYRNCMMSKVMWAGTEIIGASAVVWYFGLLTAPVLLPTAAGAALALGTYEHFDCTFDCGIDPRKFCCEVERWEPFTALPAYPRGCRHFACLEGSHEWDPRPNVTNCQEHRRCTPSAGCEECPGLWDPEPRFRNLQLAAGSDHRNLSCQDTRILSAHDPNAKSGPAGDVVPGQEMAYTVEYENVGEGTAYGVYITDELSPHLDETTLDLHGRGEFVPLTRQIVWDIGELAPKGQEGSKGERTFHVSVKLGLPSGTVITNHAIVYFPSVPEETPTNSVVNVVQPLAAVPQSLETPYGTPIGITLTGRDVSGTPLTYAIKEQPFNGELTGTAPSLTYTPADNFTGQDRLAFTVSNGVSESRIADVTILVTPSSADTIAPELSWTYPEDGATIEEVPADPVASDDTGPLYAPSVLAGFSEAMDPNAMTGTTVRVVGAGGRAVAASVAWDGTTNHAVLTPREPWQDGTYTATVTTGVRDASGNALAAEYSWSFRIGAACAFDVNADGTANDVDLLYVYRHVTLGLPDRSTAPSAHGLSTEQVNAINTRVNAAGSAFDINADGTVNDVDLLYAYRRLTLGLPDRSTAPSAHGLSTEQVNAINGRIDAACPR